MVKFQRRIGIKTDRGRTTISVDNILFNLMSLKLGFSPCDKKAEYEIRNWLEELLIPHQEVQLRGKTSKLSQYARVLICREIADKYLLERLNNEREKNKNEDEINTEVYSHYNGRNELIVSIGEK